MKLAQLFVGQLVAATILGGRYKIKTAGREERSRETSKRLQGAAADRRARRNAKRARDAGYEG